jgi:hypothetical protein
MSQKSAAGRFQPNYRLRDDREWMVGHSETIGSSHSTKSYSQFLVQSETGQIP